MNKCEPVSRRLARVMRHHPADCETVLWRWLRGRRFQGVKFRRQHPIGWYVLDFYSDELKLAIEVDGSGHRTSEQRRIDAVRTSQLVRFGIKVLRITNEEIRNSPTFVADRIAAAIQVAKKAADSLR
jgi:very-short-patch-repair endonuclease